MNGYLITSATAALTIYVVWLSAAVAHGLSLARRSGILGSTSPPQGWAGWSGAFLIAAGLATCIAAPVLSLFAVLEPPTALRHSALQTAGVALAVAGAAATIAAQRAFGYRPELVTSGPFRWVRHPIYSAAIVAVAGLVLLVPTWLHLFGFACLVLGLELKVRAVEEPDLLRAQGAAYAVYASKTGRFIPGIGKIRKSGPHEASPRANLGGQSISAVGGPDIARRRILHRRAVVLEWFTVSWNVVEAFVAIGAGIIAGSVALVGFGVDSGIEVISAVGLLWRLRTSADAPRDEETAAERRALYVVAFTFFVLTIYVGYEAVSDLLRREVPEPSRVGIVLALLSLAIMPALALLKQRTGREWGSRALLADAVETWVCSYLSLALLVGLGLNALFGWWWADAAGGLAMLPVVVWQGWEALREAREQDGDDE